MQTDLPLLSQTARPGLLLTRPAEQSARFAAAFGDRFGPGWKIVISPLTELVVLHADLNLGGISTLIFTSETAVTVFSRQSQNRSLPCWCVGARTADAARRAGFDDVRHGTGNATDLARAMIEGGVQGPCLHPRGVHAAWDMKNFLDSAGIETHEVVLYDQPSCPLTLRARGLLSTPDPVIVPLFSPRAASLAAAEMLGRRCPLWLAALSPAVADAAALLNAERLVTSIRPEAGAMLDALAQLTPADGSA